MWRGDGEATRSTSCSLRLYWTSSRPSKEILLQGSMAALVSPQSKQLILKVDVYSELRLRFLYTGSLGDVHYLQVRTAHVIDENLIILRRLFS